MPTKAKIKINDITELRERLDIIYQATTHVLLMKYSVNLAKHIMEMVNIPLNENIQNGLSLLENLQNDSGSIHELRQVSFNIHKLARQAPDEVFATAYRAIAHAIAIGHMKEHAMVASDYAIKLINILEPNNKAAVKKEREFQIALLEAATNN